MSPYIGSEDTARFITIASYRGQTAALDPSIPYNQWTNIAGPPPDSETYGRHRLALAWLLGLPGAPLLYYGDEYGEYGGVDPNNRVNWRGDSGTLSADEQATHGVRAEARAGAEEPHGHAAGRLRARCTTPTPNDLVFARQDTAGDVALEAISRLDTPTTVTTALPGVAGDHRRDGAARPHGRARRDGGRRDGHGEPRRAGRGDPRAVAAPAKRLRAPRADAQDARSPKRGGGLTDC